MKRWLGCLMGCVLIGGSILSRTAPLEAALLPQIRRVNAPYFTGPVQYDQSGIFWFGRVTSSENYADVRVGYNDTELFVNVAMFDRWLWYEESPTFQRLTNWDAVSLYLNIDGLIGDVPGTRAYRFDGQLTWWESVRTPWQAAYQGDGSDWVLAAMPFTTTTGWQGNAPNHNEEDDRGWTIFYHVPFASLGLSGPPTQGSQWGLAVVVHDRDNSAGSPPLADQTWPENMIHAQPRTWGQLHFGIPTYVPRSSVPRGTLTIRNKLNGAVVADAAVGGTMGNMCPGDSTYIWNQWADFKNPHDMQFNIQNQLDISDWPCFSKYFITFPLNAVPSGKSIVSATLTLHQFGNAGQGWDPAPLPSFIQVLTIGSDWNEDTLTWNNAPGVRENIGGVWVDPLPAYGGDPGIPRQWDVSYAAAEAYSAGEPLRLALYSADWAYHSGRYFWSSDHDDYHPEARPTVTLVWGEPAASVRSQVHPVRSQMGQQITYTLSLLSNGSALTLTDSLPSQVSHPGSIQLEGGGDVTYENVGRQLKWSGLPPVGKPVTLTVPVTVLVAGPLAVNNTAVLIDADGNVSSATTVFIIDPHNVWLPVLRR